MEWRKDRRFPSGSDRTTSGPEERNALATVSLNSTEHVNQSLLISKTVKAFTRQIAVLNCIMKEKIKHLTFTTKHSIYFM